mgnify:CR=1 FL=1
MDSVIFNGSENRKPISRASVELIFDNSLGKAPTEWAQYAEISVKRVIEREKGSTYYINNLAVRRKDIADLFLGTGLGGRGYAIIGQNTISQIIEAKPEELRNYLEEAAGVSKYKERRRETEFRLRDTRENLSRIQDVVNEIIQQLPENVYISFDIDGLNPSLCPNTGTPVAGGFNLQEISYLFAQVVASGKKIIGIDLNEVAPGKEGDWDANVGARALWELVCITEKSRRSH